MKQDNTTCTWVYCFEYWQGGKGNGNPNAWIIAAFKTKNYHRETKSAKSVAYEPSKDSPRHAPPVGIIMVFTF